MDTFKTVTNNTPEICESFVKAETTFNPGDTPSTTVIRLGDVNESFDPSSITDHAPIITGSSVINVDENQTAVWTVTAFDADGDTLTYSLSGMDAHYFSINSSEKFVVEVEPKIGVDYEIVFIAYQMNNSQVKEVKKVNGTFAEYFFDDKDLFVRVKVNSNEIKENPYVLGENTQAWIQPVIVN